MKSDQQLMQDNRLNEAIAHFRQAAPSSYLVLAWKTDAVLPLTSSLSKVNTFVAIPSPTLKKSKSTNTISRPSLPALKTTHTFKAEGRLVGLNLQTLERFLLTGSSFHVLLRADDDVVLIQQMAGASVGTKRQKALAAARSLVDLVPYVTLTISITQLDDLDREMRQINLGRATLSKSSLAKSGSILTLPGKVSSVVPRYELADNSVPSPRKAGISKPKRISVISSCPTSDSIYLDCEGSIDSIDIPTKRLQDDNAGWKVQEIGQFKSQEVAPIPPPKDEASPTRRLAPVPLNPLLSPTALIQSPINAWIETKDPGCDVVSALKWTKEQEHIKDTTEEGKREQERLRQQADDAKREQVMKKLSEEQKKWGHTWESGVPSYYDKTNDTTSTTQQRGAKKGNRSPPLSAPPPIPLPPSPDALLALTSKPITFTPPTHQYTRSSTLSSLNPFVFEDDQIHPVITLGGHVRSRSHSQSVASKVNQAASRKEADESNLSSMPPFLASLEQARKKIKDMKEDGLEGESWINKRQRERSESDAQVLAANKGWALMEPKVLPQVSDTKPLVLSKSSDPLLTRHQSLCLELSRLQKTAAEMDKVERLRNIKWAGEASYRMCMDDFERSQRESNERERRQKVEEERNEIRSKMEEIERGQREVKALIEEAQTYKGKVEQAKRDRMSRLHFEDRETQEKRQQEQVRQRVKAERRADLRVELQTATDYILAMGLITVQSSDGLRKRRRYELHREALLLFSETTSSHTTSIGGGGEELYARITAEPGNIILIRDDSEASQTLHSFLIKYYDNDDYTEAELRAYTDTEAEKERLLIGLSMLACYNLKDYTFER